MLVNYRNKCSCKVGRPQISRALITRTPPKEPPIYRVTFLARLTDVRQVWQSLLLAAVNPKRHGSFERTLAKTIMESPNRILRLPLILQARPPADFVPGTVFRSSTNLVRITFLYLDPCGSLRYHIAVLAEPLIGSTGKLEAYSRTIYHIYSLGGLLCRRLASKKKINNMLHECLNHVPSCILSIAARTGPATLSQVHHKQNQGGGEHHEDPYYVYIMYIYIRTI